MLVKEHARLLKPEIFSTLPDEQMELWLAPGNSEMAVAQNAVSMRRWARPCPTFSGTRPHPYNSVPHPSSASVITHPSDSRSRLHLHPHAHPPPISLIRWIFPPPEGEVRVELPTAGACGFEPATPPPAHMGASSLSVRRSEKGRPLGAAVEANIMSPDEVPGAFEAYIKDK